MSNPPTIPAAGWYKLERDDIENPHPDRRVTRDWTKAATFPAGIYRIEVRADRRESLPTLTTYEITRFSNNDYGRASFASIPDTARRATHDRVAALLAHLVPHEPNAHQLSVEILGASMNATTHILNELYEAGVISRGEIEQAARRIEARRESESD